MNALLLQEQIRFEKIAVNLGYFILALAIFYGQGMFLNNSSFAQDSSHISPLYGGSGLHSAKPPDASVILNAMSEKDKWETSIRSKYKNGAVTFVEDGIAHIKITKYINSQPVKINVVEINRNINPDLELSPALASDSLDRKASIKTIAQKNNAIVAINGTYFKPQTGVPLGTLMIDGKLLTGPIYNRVALGVGYNDFKMAQVQLDAKLVSKNNVLRIDNINQPRMLSTYVLVYTKDWGQMSPPSPTYGVQIAIENDKITTISNGSIPIPQNGYVIVGPREKLEPFFYENKVKVNISTMPDWNNIKHIISGGPYLVKENQIYVDTETQKFGAIGGKNPRTAIGYTEDNNLILITIDGREESSVGITLYELAKLMKSFNCYNAMNLDGGGSSIMYIKGNIVNNPSIKGGINISNAFTISMAGRISYKHETK